MLVSSPITVWDDERRIPDGIGDVLAWRSFAEGRTVASIPHHLEENADRLKAKYLEFIHDLGQCHVLHRRVVEHFDTGTGFSFWWMTHLAEKSPFKSPRVYDCLRLMALEDMLLDRRPARVHLVGSDRILAFAIRTLCHNVEISFTWKRTRSPRVRRPFRQVYRGLPAGVQGVLSLAKYLVTRWPLRQHRTPGWYSGENAVFLCSYFFNIDPVEGGAGRFYSRQWEGVPRLIHEMGGRTNWIQHFLLEEGPDAKTGLRWIRLFNRDPDRQGCHAFLESYLTWQVVRRVVKRLLWLRIVARRLKDVPSAFYPRGSAAWLWPMLERDWWRSLAGPTAATNCLWIELFEAACRQMPRQRLGLYLCENQGWERALLNAWRRHGHGEIIGVPHATVPFWHLNYFDDPRSVRPAGSCAMPVPDRVALNGPMAWGSYVTAGYPVDQLVEVEAMRYQYLSAFAAGDENRRSRSHEPAASSNERKSLRVLILGDISVDLTLRMLDCMGGAVARMNGRLLLTLKPHPVGGITRELYPGLAFELTDRPLAEIISDFDVAFSSNATSAGLDALLAGLPVAVFLEPTEFNLSPLRELPGVRFVTTPKQLAIALQTPPSSARTPAPGDFFWLDMGFSKWRELLAGAGKE